MGNASTGTRAPGVRTMTASSSSNEASSLSKAPSTHADSREVRGKYRVVRPLKVGGTASIYLAVMRGENAFSREVVIKRPLPHLVADGRARLMFVDEAHIAARLQHPNVCQVLDLVSRDDEVYLVLEYLRGVDLRELIKDGIRRRICLPVELAVWIAVEIASGLHFAHEAKGLDGRPLNLVHRDVSPKNIRITFEGSVKLIDFGIARADNRATETAAGTIKGTLGYMSPEQILGDSVDRRSDVFAFGICLFQMLTNKNPFDGASLAERVRRLTQDPIAGVRRYRPEVRPELEAIVARCLERPIDARYPTLAEAQADLEDELSRLGASSPRKRLVGWLEQHFRKARDDTDLDLASALTAAQTLDPIDPSVPLTFPDDEPARSSRGHVTGPTFTPPPSERNTEAERVGDTRQVPPPSSKGGAGPRRGVIGGVAAAAAAGFLVASVWASGALDAPRALVVETVVAAPEALAPKAANPTLEIAPVAPPTEVDSPPVVPSPKVRPPRRRPRPAGGLKGALPSGREGARLYFRAALARARAGRPDEAQLLYELSFLESRPNPPPNLHLNLGLLARDQGDLKRARACLEGYLALRPDGPEAGALRKMVEGLPKTSGRGCVSAKEGARARRRRLRSGAAVKTWIDAALKDELQ
ncbi:MAG: protein kinase [Myxococcota bacterium]